MTVLNSKQIPDLPSDKIQYHDATYTTVESELDHLEQDKVDATTAVSKIYGTDENGDPKLYELNEVGGSGIYKQDKLKAGENIVIGRADNLPDGYIRLDYIESDRTQLINTGYVLQEFDAVEVDYELHTLDTSGDKFIIGQQVPTGTSKGTWVETYGIPNKWYVRYGSTSSSSVNSTSSQYSGTFRVQKGSFKVNGVQILTPSFVEMPNTPLTLFGRYSQSGTSIWGGANVRISEVRIYDTQTDTLRHRYVACQRMSDDELGMYDLIDGVFFRNVGSGTFTASPNEYGYIISAPGLVKYTDVTSVYDAQGTEPVNGVAVADAISTKSGVVFRTWSGTP